MGDCSGPLPFGVGGAMILGRLSVVLLPMRETLPPVLKNDESPGSAFQEGGSPGL